EDPRYIVSLGEYDISGGEIKVWIPYLLREDPDDPQRRVALPVAGASGIEPFTIGRLDSIRVGSPGGPEPANLPEDGEGAVEPPARITLSRIEFGQPAGQKHYWANREQWGTTVEIEKGRSLALGADREEGYPLDLAALTEEQKEDIVMTDWNFFTTVSSGPSDGPRFYPDHEYWYWDDGFKITDPDYGRTIGIWRLNGNDIEVKLTHHEMKTYDGEGSLLKTTLVEIEGTDWETVGSLESIRIRVLVDDEGKWLHSGRITLKHHRDGVLFDKEADYWSMGGILMH
ncbi:MAG: hypothetical protein LBQ61_05850, partial [Spirochaetales bacterium]|nr:hypothetical protein [Spirochaetales bacterium]